ncbi:hypothetical protein NC653_033265 [Populus alba x Populus x berolinensis]|uniref:Aminotransferase class I/classII large domain-containing protein n=1 Tax=Populus alba x Populus x berolinensis TaxID=444605 RepID=A0AAD6LW82_9ROSI|nr:hypothetical protein NC653_033265 [Populus alba x Populus x berolinensis]
MHCSSYVRRIVCLLQVYEHITYDNIKHISLASLPGMQERTIITSSLSKTFSVTGWRVGWAIAPAFFASAIRNIHVKITDCAPVPFQEAALTALRSPPEYFENLRREYESKRDYIVHVIAGLGFQIKFKPRGALFLFAELPENYLLSDVSALFTLSFFLVISLFGKLIGPRPCEMMLPRRIEELKVLRS